MEINNVKLEAVGVRQDQYPTSGLAEIAFVGRSNVGKSTLINALMNRKALAKTSSKPGKTRTINFYNIEDSFYFVDLPGYGYARASKADISQWSTMIEDYLYNRKELLQVILLVDGRHKPTVNDVDMLNWIRHFGYEPMVIATKMDKVKASVRVKTVRAIIEGLDIDKKSISFFEGPTKAGRQEILDKIGKIIEKNDL